MKLILIISLLSLTLTNAFLFRTPEALKTVSDSAPECITGYLTAFFAHFELDQPTQMLQCFDKKSAALYFKHLYEVTNLVKDAENRDRIKVHLDWAKLAALHKALGSLHGCITATQDFSDLLHALGAEERNPELFMLAKFIYYQANFGKLNQELPQITGALDNKDWNKAGDVAANIVSGIVNDLKTQGLALNALNGLWNGVHIGLGLPDAESIWGCWNNETAAIRLEFIYEMSAAVANGKVSEAAVNTEKFYKEKGNELVRKIPSSVWKCWKDSSDTKAESDKLQVDITDQAFYERVKKFVHGHQGAYYHLQKGIKENLEQHNFIHAGSAYAHLLKAAAATK